jgi:hypothetical protein
MTIGTTAASGEGAAVAIEAVPLSALSSPASILIRNRRGGARPRPSNVVAVA